jgi:hypothetical protein
MHVVGKLTHNDPSRAHILWYAMDKHEKNEFIIVMNMMKRCETKANKLKMPQDLISLSMLAILNMVWCNSLPKESDKAQFT